MFKQDQLYFFIMDHTYGKQAFGQGSYLVDNLGLCSYWFQECFFFLNLLLQSTAQMSNYKHNLSRTGTVEGKSLVSSSLAVKLSYPDSSTVFNMLKTFDSKPQRISRKDRKAQWSTPFSLTSWMLPSNNWTFPRLLSDAKPTIQNRAFKSLRHLGGWGQSRKWVRSHIISIHLFTEHIYYLWWRSRYKSNILYNIWHVN